VAPKRTRGFSLGSKRRARGSPCIVLVDAAAEFFPALTKIVSHRLRCRPHVDTRYLRASGTAPIDVALECERCYRASLSAPSGAPDSRLASRLEFAFKDVPQGTPTTHADINADLLASASAEIRKADISTRRSAQPVATRRAVWLEGPAKPRYLSNRLRLTLMMNAAGTPITAPMKP
jgi:hypothetical protein